MFLLLGVSFSVCLNSGVVLVSLLFFSFWLLVLIRVIGRLVWVFCWVRKCCISWCSVGFRVMRCLCMILWLL